ncbi:LemA family protein [Henriciella aquimarina]|uniref:LemA family protein n=1 Tax=Henriciella aquimarina TaxID=545261 RepID=UPI000A05880C|nr:LemA family protein [Henriciella aquimarina]
MTVLYILLGALAIVAVFLIGIYNSLVAKKQRCNQAFADIDVQLKQRQNLIPNLVETVKGYAEHERGTLEEVVQARNSAVAAQSPGDMAQAEGALTSALGRLFALAESYPDLKANENFKELQDELSVIEDKLAAARRFYNAAVQDYNTSREQFPNSIVAGMFNFPEREFFDLGGDRTELSTVPEVKF